MSTLPSRFWRGYWINPTRPAHPDLVVNAEVYAGEFYN